MTDNQIILEALREYEENNYSSRDDNWQTSVNRLIAEYEER